MKRWLQLLAFLLAFTIQVRVRAESLIALPLEKSVFQFPENCLEESSICAIRTHGSTKYILERGELKITLSRATSYVRRGAAAGSLVSGMVLVKSSTPFDMETPYGLIHSDSSEYLMERTKDRFTIRVISGEVEMRPVGSNETVRVSEGYENWMGPVTASGHAQTGIPSPAVLQGLLEQWGKIFSGTKKDFETTVRHYQVAWREAVLNSSHLYLQMAQREIASEKDRQSERARRMAIEAAERKKMNEMFRRKTFE